MSCASLNQELIGTACCGWNMYEVGELSMMIVSFKSRPTCERSCTTSASHLLFATVNVDSYLHIVALVVVTAFSEKPVVDDVMYV